MEEAVRVMQLKPLMRTAIRLVKGLEINQTADRFDLAVFSIISWFKANTPPPPPLFVLSGSSLSAPNPARGM